MIAFFVGLWNGFRKNPLPYIMFFIIAALVVANAINGWRLHSAQKKISKQETKITELKDDLRISGNIADSNATTAFNLNDKLTTCINERAVDEKANALAARILATRIGSLDGRIAESKRSLDEVYAHGTCATLGAVDIAGQCPALAERLRRASAAGQDPDGGGARPGKDAAPGGMFRHLEGDPAVPVRTADGS